MVGICSRNGRVHNCIHVRQKKYREGRNLEYPRLRGKVILKFVIWVIYTLDELSQDKYQKPSESIKARSLLTS